MVHLIGGCRKISTVQETNQNCPFHLGSVCHDARTVIFGSKRKYDSGMLFGTSLLLQTCFDNNINHALK